MNVRDAISGRIILGRTTNGTPGSSGTVFARTEIDFGATPTWSKTFTVTDARVTSATMAILATISRAVGTGHSDDDDLDAFACKPGTTTTGSFSVTVQSLQGPVIGTYKLDYLILGAV